MSTKSLKDKFKNVGTDRQMETHRKFYKTVSMRYMQ